MTSGCFKMASPWKANNSTSVANSAVIDIDDLLHRGTQEYALRGGRNSGAQPV
jgi:hypothetical protein